MTRDRNESDVGGPQPGGPRQETSAGSSGKKQGPVALSFTPSRPKSDETVAFVAKATGIVPITGIAIYVGDQLVAESDSEACKYVGGPFPPGQVTVKAVAYSRSGRPGGSTTTRLTVDAADTQAPLVQIKHSPSQPTTNQKVTFTAQARDPGGVARIEILVNQRSAATNAGDQCTFVGGPYRKGTVTYGAKAYDEAGNRAWTGYQQLTVVEPLSTGGDCSIVGHLDGNWRIPQFAGQPAPTFVVEPVDSPGWRKVVQVDAKGNFQIDHLTNGYYRVIPDSWPFTGRLTTIIAPREGVIVDCSGTREYRVRFEFYPYGD